MKNSPLNSPLPIPKEGQQVPHATLMKPALPQFTAGAGYLIPGSFVPELYTGVQFKQTKKRFLGLFIPKRLSSSITTNPFQKKSWNDL